MTSIFNSYDELIQHASTNQMTVSNTKILLGELRDWYDHFEEDTEDYYSTGVGCTFVDGVQYKNIIGVETKLEQIDILISKYEQFLNEKNEY